jgi:hypothetical protein
MQIGFRTVDGVRVRHDESTGPSALAILLTSPWPKRQQAALAIRAHVPLGVLNDTIQPFPSFPGIYDAALTALRMQVTAMPPPARPMDAQMASLPG